MSSDFDLVVLLTDPNPADLAIARDQLQQAGINFQVRNENYGSLYGSSGGRLQRYAEPQLVVFRKDAQRAAEVLGIAVPPEAGVDVRHREPGIIGWVRWALGL